MHKQQIKFLKGVIAAMLVASIFAYLSSIYIETPTIKKPNIELVFDDVYQQYIVDFDDNRLYHRLPANKIISFVTEKGMLHISYNDSLEIFEYVEIASKPDCGLLPFNHLKQNEWNISIMETDLQKR